VPEQTSPPPRGDMLLYQTEDGHTRIECRLQDDTLWLNQAQLAELFQSSKQNIAKHLKAVFAEGELEADAVVNSWLTTGPDGKRYRVLHYRLEAILAVGYRVRSSRGTAFRQWATAQLREYLVKGFAMDDMRLKQNGGEIYFDELLARIRDIRSSEKVFWRKVLDIYATSIDYNAATEASQQFFAALQNKMHWAAHGHTAAEVIVQRADARKPNMGLTSFAGAVHRYRLPRICRAARHPAPADDHGRLDCQAGRFPAPVRSRRADPRRTDQPAGGAAKGRAGIRKLPRPTDRTTHAY
jgi:hypothetical protein